MIMKGGILVNRYLVSGRVACVFSMFNFHYFKNHLFSIAYVPSSLRLYKEIKCKYDIKLSVKNNGKRHRTFISLGHIGMKCIYGGRSGCGYVHSHKCTCVFTHVYLHDHTCKGQR